MIYRAFPRLAEVVVVQHKQFALFGIENVHMLEYKEPTEIARKKLFISLEKFLRRIRGWILKLDIVLSKLIEIVQQKNQKPATNKITEEPALPAVKAPEIMPTKLEQRNIAPKSEIQNLIVIKEKPKNPPRRKRIVQDIAVSKVQESGKI